MTRAVRLSIWHFGFVFRASSFVRHSSFVLRHFTRFAGSQKNFAARTKSENFAMPAIRLARETAPPSVPDEPVTPVRPMLARHQLHQIALDFSGSTCFVKRSRCEKRMTWCRPRSLRLCETRFLKPRWRSCDRPPVIRAASPSNRGHDRQTSRRLSMLPRECSWPCSERIRSI